MAIIYLIKVNNGNTRPMCKICPKLTIPEQQKFITKYVRFFIIKYDSFFTKCDSITKCVDFNIKCNNYYKMRPLSQNDKVHKVDKV